jgi:formylglycine-generating enzyme
MSRIYNLITALFVCILLSTPAYATERIAVLELTSDAAPESVLLTITDSVRSGTRDVLSGDEYIVMTRQNMITVLGDNGIDASCVEGQCELDLARAMQANLVVTGRLIRVEGQYHLNLNIYNVGNGDLLKAEDVWADSTRELIDVSALTARILVQEALGLSAGATGAVATGTEGRLTRGGGLDLGSSSSVAIVTFESEPAGAVVLVDNQLICPSTPCTRDVSPGAHRVTMQAERYHSSEERVSVSGDDTVSMTLSPAFGLLSVVTTPRGLPVKVNGDAVGDNVQAVELAAGTYDVVVETDCYAYEGQRIVLNEGDNRSVTIAPPLREAGLDLRLSDESGNTLRGRVFADDTEIGRAPGRMAVPVCHEELRVEADGGLGWRGELELVENEVRSHELTLEARGAAGGGPAGITWVRIPSGTFQMGSTSGDADERPVHDVFLDDFEISRTEITIGQYRACVDAGVCRAPGLDCQFDTLHDEYPVACVSWSDALLFADWAGARLPTEAEWEYAAGAGEGFRYSGSNNELSVGWVARNSGLSSHPVGQLSQNGRGLFDMTGNVWEWVNDWYFEEYYRRSSGSNPQGNPNGTRRVVRGGGWESEDSYARVANRVGLSPNTQLDYLGFRIAR